MLKPWWESWPGRLEYELRALEAAGIPHELDAQAFADGAVIIRLKPKVCGSEISLAAKFPDSYPYTRFEVSAPDLDLTRHQHPFSKNLCLIGRGSHNWHVTDTLARMIKEQLPRVLASVRGNTGALAADLEEHQGEPFSDYYCYAKNAVLLIDSSWSIERSVTAGELTIGVEGPAKLLLRGAVLEVRDTSGRVLAQADPAISRLYPVVLGGRWVREQEPVLEESAKRFLAGLSRKYPFLKYRQWQSVLGGGIEVIGAIFPEEVRWQEKSDGWVFVVHLNERRKGFRKCEKAYFVRAGRAGSEDFVARIPELRALRDRRIAVVGLGCLGAPSCIEFARASVGELRILDHDAVDAGTTVRWPLGLPAVGVQKPAAIEQFISVHYPHTRVQAFDHRVGAVRNGGPSEIEILDSFLKGVDLLYDATAELGVQHLLSDLAMSYRIPYICVSATNGAWGGRVVRICPGKTPGCWVCLQHALDEGVIPVPPEAPGEFVQPEGCANPTFTGASFDIAQVWAVGVRLALGTLTGESNHGYPNTDWDVAVLSLRQPGGRPLVPCWETFALQRHPSCVVCAER